MLLMDCSLLRMIFKLMLRLDIGFIRHHHFENLVKQNSGDRTHYLFDLKSGLLFGQLSSLTGEPSSFKVTSGQICLQIFLTLQSRLVIQGTTRWWRNPLKVEKSIVFELDHNLVIKLVVKYPRFAFNLTKLITSRLSPFVKMIDFAVRCIQVDAGRIVFSKNEPGQ